MCDNGNDPNQKTTIEKTVLVIYTGGTIGMRQGKNGLEAGRKRDLEQTLSSNEMLHDEEYAKQSKSKESKGDLVLPYNHGTRVWYTIVCLKKNENNKEEDYLIDSSNVTAGSWNLLVQKIQEKYNDFDGFIVLHGTDTMTYTASALSFAIQNLTKSVVLTGSQVPIFETGSDGKRNLLSSLIFAGCYCVPEVTICFGSKILRGNRTIKIDCEGFEAFESPDFPPLATICGITFDVKEQFCPHCQEEVSIKTYIDHKKIYYTESDNGSEWSQQAKESINPVFHQLSSKVGLLRVFPGITGDILQPFMETTKYCGLVLQTYGAGNAPSNIIEKLKEGIKDTRVVINITQCSKGFVQSSYQLGQQLLEAGVIPGNDMTTEAAFTKLAYLIGDKNIENGDLCKIETLMQTNLRGEMTERRKYKINRKQ